MHRESSDFKRGDLVRHSDSGWGGEVIDVRPDDSGMRGSQGPLITVRVTHPKPPERPWKPITVTAAELEAHHAPD